jgi:hypothetical protein
MYNLKPEANLWDFPEVRTSVQRNLYPRSLHEYFRERKFGDDHFPGFVIRDENNGKDLHPGSFLFPAKKACTRYDLHRHEPDQFIHKEISSLIRLNRKGNTVADEKMQKFRMQEYFAIYSFPINI